MPAEDNKVLFRRLVDEVINKGNLDAADQFVAPNWADNMGEIRAIRGMPGGLEGFKRVFALFFQGFPDLHYTIDEMVAEGDKIGVLTTVSGTHKGEFMGIAPTGKSVAVTHTNILRIADGKFVECWGASTWRGLLEQLGVILVTG